MVYAVGYERENTFEIVVDGQPISSHSLSSYDTVSGEITRLYQESEEKTFHSIKNGHCFGLGIAFPTTYVDGEGNVEAWVGFHRNIEQMRRILSKLNKGNIITGEQ